MDWEPSDELRTARLGALIRATGFLDATVQLADLAGGTYGLCWPTGGHEAFIARRLPNPQAQAAALHEAAHWALGHLDNLEFAAARARDEVEGSEDARRLWETEADALACAFAEDLADLLDDPDATLQCLADDVTRFG